jgi:hypothetical protein
MSLFFQAAKPLPLDIIFGNPSFPLIGSMDVDYPLIGSNGFYSGRVVCFDKITPPGATTPIRILTLCDGSQVGVTYPAGIYYGCTFPTTPLQAAAFNSGVQLTAFKGKYRVSVFNPYKGDTKSLPCFVDAPTTPYTVDCPLYAGCAAANTVGMITSDVPYTVVTTPATGTTPASSVNTPVANPVQIGTCTHVPVAKEPWLELITCNM